MAVIIALCPIVFFAVRWLLDTWGEIAADEIVYHLHASLEGTNPQMVVDALLRYVAPCAGAVASLVIVLVVLRRHRGVRAALAGIALVLSLALAALGATIEGDRLGLGTNVYSTVETLIERDGDACWSGLGGPSDFLMELGEFTLGPDTLESSRARHGSRPRPPRRAARSLSWTACPSPRTP